jgi:hypothetical protein
VYQVLASCLDVSYVSNLIALFSRSPITAAKLFRPFRRRTNGDFKSFFGQTSRLSGPNDGFMIWDRWLGSNRYEPGCDLGVQEKAEMAGFFSAWTSAFTRPFLNKNNRNTVCIDVLADSLPNAWFVVVRRDLAATARSLIRAREQVQGDKRFGWGLLSDEEHANDDDLGYVDDVCQQVLEIDRQVSEQLQNVDPSRVVNISYEEFCDAPAAFIDALVRRVPGLDICQQGRGGCPPSFTRSSSPPLSQKEEERIASCIAAYSDGAARRSSTELSKEVANGS